jgi:predicted nucleotidyltransferase
MNEEINSLGEEMETDFSKQIHNEKIKAILDQLLTEVIKRWDKKVVSMVMFGSFARGNAHEHSDIDVLLIIEDLPKDWRTRSTFELSFERLGLKWGMPLQVIMVEPEEMEYSINHINPLLLEIREKYYCVFDRNGYFQGKLKDLERVMSLRKVRKLSDHMWEIPDIAYQ